MMNANNKLGNTRNIDSKVPDSRNINDKLWDDQAMFDIDCEEISETEASIIAGGRSSITKPKPGGNSLGCIN